MFQLRALSAHVQTSMRGLNRSSHLFCNRPIVIVHLIHYTMLKLHGGASALAKNDIFLPTRTRKGCRSVSSFFHFAVLFPHGLSNKLSTHTRPLLCEYFPALVTYLKIEPTEGTAHFHPKFHITRV